MGKKSWLLAACFCLLLCGCDGSSADNAAQPIAEEAAVCEAAPEAPAEAGEATTAAVQSGAVRSGTYVYEGNKDEVISDGLTYFTFTESARTHCDEAGTPLLLESLTQTAFYSECKIQTAWINGILADLQASDEKYGSELLEYARKDQKEAGESFYCHSHYVSRGVARHDENVISLLSLASVYSGGMQSYVTQTALNFDMRELRSLILEDVVEESGCAALGDLLVQKVEEKFASLGDTLVSDYKRILSDAVTYGKMTPYWYFNEQGLVIFFNQYELTPYAAGIVKVELEYGALDGILKESYFPEEIKGWISSISVDDKANGANVYDVPLGAGETVYITLNGTASHVQMSEVSFVEQTAVDSRMLFSANRLNEETTLAVTVDLDPEICYAVEYYEETGGPRILYFKDNKILTELQ